MRSLVCLLCLAPLLPAQETPPTFRTGTRLVEVSVTVSGKQGVPVKDLTKEDFTVFDKGKRQEIAFFRFEGAKQESNPKPLSPGMFTNRTEALSGAPRNVVALVMDSLNTQPQDKIRVRAQVLRYLQRLAPSTRVALFHMGAQLKVIHDFTDDAESLRKNLEASAVGIPMQHEVDLQQSIAQAEQIIESLAGDPMMQAMMERLLRAQIEADQVANAVALRRRVELTMASMESLGRHLAGIPGRKNIIWISGGVSMVAVTGSMGMGPQGDIRSFEPLIVQTSRRLAQQDVALYIVDAKGLQGESYTDASSGAKPVVRGRGRFERQADSVEITTDNRSALGTIASITGGRFLFNTNDMLEGFKYALADMEGSYTVAFYAQDEPDNKWRDIKVKVNRPGVKVLHRQGYLAEPALPKPSDWNDENWRAAVSNPLGSSGLKLTARCERTANGQIALELWLDASTLHFNEDKDGFHGAFEISISDRTADGRARMHFETGKLSLKPEQMAQLRQQGIPYQRQWAPLEGAATIRVIVRDKATGLYGTLDIPMKDLRAAN